MHYLNARQTLRRLIDWRVVPGRQRERHDRDRRDHVRRQRLPLGAGRDPARGAAAGPAHRHRRPAHRRPAPRPRGRAGRARSTTSPTLDGFEIGQRTSAFGSGGMRSKVAAAEMASAAGIPVVICDGTAAGHAGRRGGGRERRDAASRRTPSARRRFKLWLRYAKPSHGRLVVDAGAARVLREQGSSLLPVGITARRGRVRAPATRSRSSATATSSARGSRTTRRPSWPGSRACAPTRSLEQMPQRLRGGDPPRPLRAHVGLACSPDWR